MKHYIHDIQHSIIGFTVLLATVSCTPLSKSIEDTLQPKPDAVSAQEMANVASNGEIPQEVSLFSSVRLLDSIQQSLQELPALQDKDVMVYSHIAFHDAKGGNVEVSLQDPDHPEKIYSYTFQRGTGWEQPHLLETYKEPDLLKSELIPLRDIRFSTAKKVHDQIMEKMQDIENPDKLWFINFFYYANNPHPGRWSADAWRINRYYNYTFDIDGNFLSERRK